MSSADVDAVHRELADLVDTLTEARRDLGDLPQHRLATLLGVSAHTVQDWETGDDYPTVRHLIGWARLVGFKLALFDDDEQPVRLPVAREPDESFEQYELRRLVASLRDLRTAHPRIAQSKVADRAGVSRISIVNWENLDASPRSSGFVRWVQALDCRLKLVRLRP